MRSRLQIAEVAAAGLAVVVGWATAVTQLAQDGWAHGGTGWLLVFCLCATLGAGILLKNTAPQTHAVRAIGLLLVVLSPTVFIYPLNVVVLVLALVEAYLALTSRVARSAPDGLLVKQ